LIHYDAVFYDGTNLIAVDDRFDTQHAADQYGRAHHTNQTRYLGAALRVRPDDFARHAARQTLEHADLQTDRRAGIIHSWPPDRRYGFATDLAGECWFVSDHDLPCGHTRLDEGTLITFAGNANPPNGAHYPRAYSIRIQPGT
jgi:hypothetical protein